MHERMGVMDIVHMAVSAFGLVLSLYFADSMRRREPLRRHYLTLIFLLATLAYLLSTS